MFSMKYQTTYIGNKKSRGIKGWTCKYRIYTFGDNKYARPYNAHEANMKISESENQSAMTGVNDWTPIIW